MAPEYRAKSVKQKTNPETGPQYIHIVNNKDGISDQLGHN